MIVCQLPRLRKEGSRKGCRHLFLSCGRRKARRSREVRCRIRGLYERGDERALSQGTIFFFFGAGQAEARIELPSGKHTLYLICAISPPSLRKNIVTIR